MNSLLSLLLLLIGVLHLGDCIDPFLSHISANRHSNYQHAKREFNPYQDNGGTMIAIAGKNFTIVAADMRLSDQYLIRSRSISRIFQVDDGVFLSGSGCHADLIELKRTLELQSKLHAFDCSTGICDALETNSLGWKRIANLLGHTLYSRRSLPYYSFNVLASLDDNGRGAVFKYDCLGSFERVSACCLGKGEQLLQPMLDEVTNIEQEDSLWKEQSDGRVMVAESKSSGLRRGDFSSVDSGRVVMISAEEAQQLVERLFRAACEREITIGDSIHIIMIAKDHQPDDQQTDRDKRSRFRITNRIVKLPSH